MYGIMLRRKQFCSHTSIPSLPTCSNCSTENRDLSYWTGVRGHMLCSLCAPNLHCATCCQPWQCEDALQQVHLRSYESTKLRLLGQLVARQWDALQRQPGRQMSDKYFLFTEFEDMRVGRVVQQGGADMRSF